jgi:hypothetical protein
MYKFVWDCALCKAENETELPWKQISNNQGFASNCTKCGVGNDIEVDLKVQAYSESICFVDNADPSRIPLQ